MTTEDPRFDELFTVYYKPVVSYVMRLIGSLDDAEDIAIDAFTALARRRDRWEPDEDARRFVYRAAHNKALDILRTDATRSRLLDKMTEGDIPGMGMKPLNTHIQVEHEETLAAVDRIIQAMPLQRRSVASLRWEQGYGNKEIAEVLGVSVKTVELHVSLALKTLREQLQKFRD